MDRHKELAKDFIRRVRSDESSLGDFHDEETNDKLIQEIHSTYGVDVSDISNGNLLEIFDRIAKKGEVGTE